MFQIGEYVVDVNNGICKIEDVVTPDFVTDKSKKYYLVIPIKEEKAKIYISLEKAENEFRKILTKEEITELLGKINEINSVWVANDREREQIYRESVRSGNPEQLVGIIKTLYYRREKRNNEGKKNTVIDDKYFKQAEENLYSEIGFVLNLNKDDVKELIKKKVGE